MKKLLLLFVCLIILSCDKKRQTEPQIKKSSDSVVVYNINEYEDASIYAKGNKKRIIIIDSACINAKKHAINDIKNGKLVYYFYAGNFTTMCEIEKIKELFTKRGIKVDYVYGASTCIPIVGWDKFNDFGYEEIMNAEFEKCYGKAFIDSMHVTKDQQKLDCSKNIKEE